ncbi:MAG TPA: amidinotransferase [Planctomycetota bacterium]|nr:amidinotransferase [Planctomycetota bacterium]
MFAIDRREDLDFELDDLPRCAMPKRVLVADPEHFELAYAINPHMRDERGNLHRVDRELARAQWQAWLAALRASGLEVEVLEPLAGQPDFVFCANQALPVARDIAPDGVARAVPSRMAHVERAGEVAHVVAALERMGYRVDPPAKTSPMEGMGDGLWHPGRRLLWAGVGPRSSRAAWHEIAARYRVPTLLLELVDPKLYHLDTALALLSEDACLWAPHAFNHRGQELVRAFFPRAIEADTHEAHRSLACNAFCADGKTVFIESGAVKTAKSLERAGFAVQRLDTSEFLKSGGSLFCMKLLHGPV